MRKTERAPYCKRLSRGERLKCVRKKAFHGRRPGSNKRAMIIACRESSITSRFTKCIPPWAHGRVNVSRDGDVREAPVPATNCMIQDINSFSRWEGGLTKVTWYVILEASHQNETLGLVRIHL